MASQAAAGGAAVPTTKQHGQVPLLQTKQFFINSFTNSKATYNEFFMCFHILIYQPPNTD